MTAILKVTSIGNSTGIILSKELLAKLRVQKGDQLYATETPNGIELTPYRADFAETIEAAREVMRENRDVLRRLAK
ncbi:AbrB/MazE/SpoVT family DNA-binding domain-containing protein [Granulicella sp. dw_53]|uniref:AbrB/MazE/SpoVT family DNA-binding domain-containing protein n=1 Tax=Granulicella sp. dw_53 TaxID=2719792 RepID=UPI001BD6A23B|nr:AbrB/MazE/SpoVT family DNA-binding domain-containing protein [Granulicella sp. dw_53]